MPLRALRSVGQLRGVGIPVTRRKIERKRKLGNVRYIFAQTIETVGRQPNAEARIAKYCWIGFALVEAVALYGLVLAFIIMGNIS